MKKDILRFGFSICILSTLFVLATPQLSLGQEFKVASFNVWGVIRPVIKDPSRFKDIPKILDATDYDVILIQEAFTHLSKHAADVKTYPYRAKGPKAAPKFLNSGIQILSRWPIIRKKTTRFKKCAKADCLASKGGLIVTIEGPGGVMIDIMNTHLQAGGPEKIRKNQISQLKKLVDSYESTNPLVVGGDWNLDSVQTPELYSHLKQEIAEEDTFITFINSPEGALLPDEMKAGYTSDSVANYWKHKAGDKGRKRLDMILVKNNGYFAAPQLRVKTSKVILNELVKGRHLSDHFGVETVFDIDFTNSQATYSRNP